MSIIIDAKGLSCPEPVLLTQTALKQHPGKALSIEVSTTVARDNVSRLLTKLGRSFTATDREDGFHIQVAE